MSDVTELNKFIVRVVESGEQLNEDDILTATRLYKTYPYDFIGVVAGANPIHLADGYVRGLARELFEDWLSDGSPGL